MDIFEKHPDLEMEFNRLCQTRRNELLQEMVETDGKYDVLRRTRTDASMRLRDALADNHSLLEEYANAVFAQEGYELDALYRQGFLDALQVLKELDLL